MKDSSNRRNAKVWLDHTIQEAATKAIRLQISQQADAVSRETLQRCASVPQHVMLNGNSRALISWLENAQRQERARLLRGDPAYSLQKHIAIRRALIAERSHYEAVSDLLKE